MKNTLTRIKEYLLSRRGSLTVCITLGTLTVLVCAGVLIWAAFSQPGEPAPGVPTGQTEPTTAPTESTAPPTEETAAPTEGTEPATAGTTGCAHTYERVTVREMTCTDPEESKHVCTKCGKETGPYITQPTEYHTVDGVELPADCAYDLFVGKSCDKCGADIEAREDITHDFLATSTPATCTEQGVTANTCTVCGYSEESVLPATGHNMLKYNFLLPSCRSAGYEEYRCSNCHAMERTELEKLPHESTEPTCEDDGRCEKCYAVIAEALGHEYAYGICTRCDSPEHKIYKNSNVLYQEPGVRNYFGGHDSWFTVYNAKEIILSEDGIPVARFNIDVNYMIAQYYWSDDTYDEVSFEFANLTYGDKLDLSLHPELYIDNTLYERKNQGTVSGYILVPLAGFGEYEFTVPTHSCKNGRYSHDKNNGFILTVNDDVPGAKLLKEYLDDQAS